MGDITSRLRWIGKYFGLRDYPDMPVRIDPSVVLPTIDVSRGVGEPGELLYLEDNVTVVGGTPVGLVDEAGQDDRVQYQLLMVDFELILTPETDSLTVALHETPLFPSATAVVVAAKQAGFDAPPVQAADNWEYFTGHLCLPRHRIEWRFINASAPGNDYQFLFRRIWWKQPAGYRSGIAPRRGLPY